MIQVKICGITNKKEIEYLNVLKPEYIGFVFTKSKRQVTGNQAKKLCSNLNEEIKKVGVFRDNSIDEILDILDKVDLNVLQLHGSEDEEFITLLKKSINKSMEIWKAVSIKDIKSAKKYIIINKQDNEGDNLIDNILIDGENPGSGEAFSLENISEYFKENCEAINGNDCFKQYNFFLAGGITDENVILRITETKPKGIDVSSGVEIIDENGIRTKSFEKMKKLIEKVKSVNN
ncbi:N-(5'-phosphoribosyl)anthranilate isomerase [Clostridium puniceum]|uniref:N-(5'-phosphoribosyl)anthranilate isomerase n=1 Tax=Clostridium puniceum TaxID=29367 RepID=A0A1S8TAS0_9CLOT|nr:phosphoribosylanthranilate isomerase [Clostridium puniceum]OOM74848.1 N-(5'-phosphoribosyl)anthranilate isomerase [Clostridium puniceum]